MSFDTIIFVRRLVGVLTRLGIWGTCELMNEAGLGDMGSYIYLGKRIDRSGLHEPVYQNTSHKVVQYVCLDLEHD